MPPQFKQRSFAQAEANLSRLTGRLDEYQSKVAAWRPGRGNARVVACAGSGKTTTITALVGALVQEGIDTDDLLVSTFTNKAGKELVRRLATVVPGGLMGSLLRAKRVGTFHALAIRHLRTLDPESWSMSRCVDAGRTTREEQDTPSSWFLWKSITGWQEVPGLDTPGLDIKGAKHEDYESAYHVALARNLDPVETATKLPRFAKAAMLYEKAKEAGGWWDFSDALGHFLGALGRGELKVAPKVVIVDEAQDNTTIECMLARALSMDGELLLFGDYRQAIFGWRGGDPEGFKDVVFQDYDLPINYRSVPVLVEAGNALAHGQPWALGLPARPFRKAKGDIQVLPLAESPAHEAQLVADEIDAVEYDYNDIAILCRTNALAGIFEAELMTRGIPCVVVGGTAYFSRSIVRDALAYVQLSYEDDPEALSRIANAGRQFIGKAYVRDILSHRGAPFYRGAYLRAEQARGRQKKWGEDLYQALMQLRSTKNFSAVLKLAVSLCKPPKEVEQEGDRSNRTDYLEALSAISERFESARDLVEYAASCQPEKVGSEAGASKDELPKGRVVISTIHKAKGLEWKVCFVPCSSGVLPFHRAATKEDLEGERKLAYVAFTRAKDLLVLSASATDARGGHAGYSSYIRDIGYMPGEPEPDADRVPEVTFDTTHDGFNSEHF